MDTLSHALWGRGFFGYRGKPYWSLFFGALPDFFSFGIFFIITFVDRVFNDTDIDYKNMDLPDWLYSSYDVTHSMVIAFITIGIVYFFVNKNFAFAMLAWPLHILVDFPFHTADFFPTPASEITEDSTHPPDTDPIISPCKFIAIWPPTCLGELPQVEITVASATFSFFFNQLLVGV